MNLASEQFKSETGDEDLSNWNEFELWLIDHVLEFPDIQPV